MKPQNIHSKQQFQLNSLSHCAFPTSISYDIEPKVTARFSCNFSPKIIYECNKFNWRYGKIYKRFYIQVEHLLTKYYIYIKKSFGYPNNCDLFSLWTILYNLGFQPLWPFRPPLALSLLYPSLLCDPWCPSLSLASWPNLVISLPLYNPKLLNPTSSCSSGTWLWLNSKTAPPLLHREIFSLYISS